MRRFLLEILRAPKTAEPLIVYAFESSKAPLDGEESITHGILVARNSKKAFPIIKGIPVMLESAFPEEFLQRYADEISEHKGLCKLNLEQQSRPEWSFSSEWAKHFDAGVARTWSWTVEQRIRQFLLETGIDPEWCRGKLILDAGCGNGQLSEGLSGLGAKVVGVDYSNSVFSAERHRTGSTVYFLQGDLQSPPFDIATFDLIISNGVLHHTQNTFETFAEVAKLVKPDGRFYVWLYRKPEKFLRRYLFYGALDLVRLVVSRAPSAAQALIVKAYALGIMLFHKILGKRRDLSWAERIIGAYDTLTPRWRHYHTPLEVSSWFFLSGFSPPTITHWDNPYGFGMFAIKTPQEDTPGVNFGRSAVKMRYWQ